MTFILRTLMACLLLLQLGACDIFPGVGPSTQAMQTSAEPLAGQSTEGYVVVPLNAPVLAAVSGQARQSLHAHFGTFPTARRFAVGVGDRLSVTIWEAGAGGLFTAASIDGGGGSLSVTLPTQEVGLDGAITIPYAGRIDVIGATLGEIEGKIVTALDGRAIEPQAIVSLVQNNANIATVTGTIAGGARVPLSRGGDRLLDVIATAGGVAEPLQDVTVSINRQGRSMSIPLNNLIEIPRENITIAPGDTITLQRSPRTFTALGATRQNALITIDTVRLTLDKAVAQAGGLTDALADPGGVFVLRREPRELVRQLAPDFAALPEQAYINVIYQANLRDPDGLFLASRFEVRPDDLLYVSGAGANALQAFLRLVQLPFLTARIANVEP